MAMDTLAAAILVILTLFVPPIGVFCISGCSADFFINILFTLLGYIPGHVHAFYCEFVYYDRRSARLQNGRVTFGHAPMIFSEHIQNGGATVPNHVPYPP